MMNNVQNSQLDDPYQGYGDPGEVTIDYSYVN